MKQLIQPHHKTIGGMPYDFTVKLDITRQRFRVCSRGMLKLTEFIMLDMIYVMERIASLEKSAPKIPMF